MNGPEALLLIACIPLYFLLKGLWMMFKLPHKHQYTTTTVFAKYAKCWCGSGICLKEAEKDGVKIYGP